MFEFLKRLYQRKRKTLEVMDAPLVFTNRETDTLILLGKLENTARPIVGLIKAIKEDFNARDMPICSSSRDYLKKIEEHHDEFISYYNLLSHSVKEQNYKDAQENFIKGQPAIKEPRQSYKTIKSKTGGYGIDEIPIG